MAFRRTLSWLALGSALLVPLSASAKKKSPVEPPPPQPPVIVSHVAATPTPAGSLWSEAEARILIGMDGNARRVGDLITVRIYEATETELTADTSTSRTSDVSAGVGALFGLETSVLNANPNMGEEISLSAGSASTFAGAGSTRRAGSLEGVLTCKVMDVLPNGNLLIWGWKQVRSNRETQYLVLTGQVRPRDIQLDNTVDSYLLAEAKIEFTGSGTVAERQGPGIGQRVVDAAWPF